MTSEFEVAELAEICFTGALEEFVIASSNSSQSSNNNEIKKPEQPKDQVFQDKDGSIRLKN